jgi:hypothetical protein
MALLPFTVLLALSVCLIWMSHIALEHVVPQETSDAAKMQHKQQSWRFQDRTCVTLQWVCT